MHAASGGLGFVEGLIGPFQEVCRGFAVLGEQGNADAAADPGLVSASEHKRRLELTDDFVRDGRHAIGARNVFEHDHELVAADACQGVDVAQARGQARCHGGQQLVAGLVASFETLELKSLSDQRVRVSWLC